MCEEELYGVIYIVEEIKFNKSKTSKENNYNNNNNPNKEKEKEINKINSIENININQDTIENETGKEEILNLTLNQENKLMEKVDILMENLEPKNSSEILKLENDLKIKQNEIDKEKEMNKEKDNQNNNDNNDNNYNVEYIQKSLSKDNLEENLNSKETKGNDYDKDKDKDKDNNKDEDHSESLSSKQFNSFGPFIGQITGTIKDCCRQAFLNSEPRLYEALYQCLFQIRLDSIGKIHSVINKRRGKVKKYI